MAIAEAILLAETYIGMAAFSFGRAAVTRGVMVNTLKIRPMRRPPLQVEQGKLDELGESNGGFVLGLGAAVFQGPSVFREVRNLWGDVKNTSLSLSAKAGNMWKGISDDFSSWSSWYNEPDLVPDGAYSDNLASWYHDDGVDWNAVRQDGVGGANRAVGTNVKFASNIDEATEALYAGLNQKRASLLAENNKLNRPVQRRTPSNNSGRIVEVTAGNKADSVDGALPWTKQVKTTDGTMIKYDNEGFPVFDDVLHVSDAVKANMVKIKLTGSYHSDFAAANKLAGIDDEYLTVNKLTWHHHQDLGVMQLVPTAYLSTITEN